MSLYIHHRELPEWQYAINVANKVNEFSAEKLKIEDGKDFDALLGYVYSISLKIAKGFRSRQPGFFQQSLEEAQAACENIEEELEKLHRNKKISSKEKSVYRSKVMIIYRSLDRIKTQLHNGLLASTITKP